MNVEILAYTYFCDSPLLGAYDYRARLAESPNDAHVTSDADTLSEAAGRICYKSFGRPNPRTRGNRDYLANILAQNHTSVMEHASVSFLVRGVSRALLAELSRHRHLSFSVESQRYVDYSESEPVIPPAIRGTVQEDDFRAEYSAALDAYRTYVSVLLEDGVSRKKAREAARGVLPNCAPVDMVVTGNLRAWRDVLGKRWHVAADAEIREFAGLVLDHLRVLAPGCVQDLPAAPFGTKESN